MCQVNYWEDCVVEYSFVGDLPHVVIEKISLNYLKRKWKTMGYWPTIFRDQCETMGFSPVAHYVQVKFFSDSQVVEGFGKGCSCLC